MILKLTQIPTEAQDFDTNIPILVNIDHVAAIAATKITLKTPIIGAVNEWQGSTITLNGGQAFPVQQTPDEIYEMLPYSLRRDRAPSMTEPKVI